MYPKDIPLSPIRDSAMLYTSLCSAVLWESMPPNAIGAMYTVPKRAARKCENPEADDRSLLIRITSTSLNGDALGNLAHLPKEPS